jgi:FkbM family methyltransferase
MVSGLAGQGVRPRTVLDAGANKGQFTIAARNLLKPERIHAFEPLPEVGQELARHCARYPEILVHRMALGAADGKAVLHVNAHSQSSSLLALQARHLAVFPDAREQSDVVVKVGRLDESLAGEPLAAPVLLKVDTQGYEADVLAGATGVLDRLDYVVLETSFTPLYEGERIFREILSLMESLSFVFTRPVGSLRDPHTGEYLQMDALFSRQGSIDG